MTILPFYLLLGELSISALSQTIKALLLPLLCISLYNRPKTSQLPPKNNKIITIIIVLLFLSLPFSIRLPFGSYIDLGTGFFRHSVDFAVFTIISAFYLFQFSGLSNFFSIMILVPTILIGHSRSLLPIISLYLLIRRPVIVLILILISILVVSNFNIINEDIIPDKILNIIKLFISGNFQDLIKDSSLLIRVTNFLALFENMSGADYIFGLSREEIIKITTSASQGDVSTDNIILYKAIFFGIPFGLLLVFFSLLSIWLLSRNFLLFIMLFTYGMIQDWLSNGFCIFILYVFFKYLSQWHLPVKRI